MKLALAAALLLACGHADRSASAHVDGVVATVDDLDVARAWFVDELGAVEDGSGTIDGLAVHYDGLDTASFARLAIGDERVTLIDFAAPPRHRAAFGASNDAVFQHLALVVDDIDRAHARLAGHIAPISPAPQRIPDSNLAAAGVRAFYFRGPSERPLELIWFPADKGAARWHVDAHAGRVLGIDHTAIAVADTERSLGFYRDLLGLAVVGGSLNEGIEQERLSGVGGARVRITSLRGELGPGVELLEYLAPGDGAPRPVDLTARDPAHTETSIVVGDLDATLAAARRTGVVEVSRAPGPCLGCTDDLRAFLIEDPDGHVVRLLGT